MAEAIGNRYERMLKNRLEKFLLSGGEARAILSVLSDWQSKDWGPYLFGGFLRDILLLGIRRYPRDIDVVITQGCVSDVEENLRPYLKRRTRFGGFQLEMNRWHFDVWPLETTWAFVNTSNLSAIPANLPRTTFLNVEAIAVAIGPHGQIGEVFEAGFFDAVRKRILDINLEENPYPALAAVRALATAKKLRFAMSVRLARYVLATQQRLGVDALVAAQDAHYGFVRFRRKEIETLIRYIAEELKADAPSSLWLPGIKRNQLSLWS